MQALCYHAAVASLKKIFYAGDSGPSGAASYLLAVLVKLGITTTHVPPFEKIDPALFREKYDAFVLSDFPYANMDLAAERLIMQQVRDGSGLLMIGGWASFTGASGGWKGSAVEAALPVECLETDDRRNVAQGLLISARDTHAMFEGFSFVRSPVLCGINEVRLRRNGKTLLAAKPILQEEDADRKNLRLSLHSQEYPLLVIDPAGDRRIGAFMTDIAPHWCGGLVDWGPEREMLHVAPGIRVEVGSTYVEFLSRLIGWLAG
ncbi:MAG: glutamine amidotransferase [Candidatus Omnitrophota bacterium]